MDLNEKIKLANKIAKLRHIQEVKPYLLYIPHKIQKLFHESIARIKGFFGGNRSGKTLAGIMEIILECLGIHINQKLGFRPMPPLYWRIVTTGFTNGIEKVIRPFIEKWLPKGSYKYDEKKSTYTLFNGSKIELMSYDQEKSKFGGASRDGVMFDEEPPYEIYQECMMRVMDRKGKILFCMTPENGMSWVYDEIYLKQSDKHIDVFHASPFDNPALDRQEIEIWKEKLDEDTQKIKIYGQFIHRSGLIYKAFNKKDHILEPFKIPKDWTRYIGIDPGMNNPTGVLWLAVDPYDNFYIYDELLVKGKTVPEVAKLIKAKIGNDRIRHIVIDWAAKAKDQTSGISVRHLFAKEGVRASTGKKDVSAGISAIQMALASNVSGVPRLRVFTNCSETIKEFLSYVWDDYKHNAEDKDKKEKPKKKNDHLLDCLRYIILLRPMYVEEGKQVFRAPRNEVTGYWR